jgi:hypothetical protein
MLARGNHTLMPAALQKLYPPSPSGPLYRHQFTFHRVTASMQFGRWHMDWMLMRGDHMPKDSNLFVLVKVYKLIPRARLTLRRYYVRPEPITENTGSV